MRSPTRRPCDQLASGFSYSPAAALEWRGHLTVRAIAILPRNHSI
jgi:hypothetical protein